MAAIDISTGTYSYEASYESRSYGGVISTLILNFDIEVLSRIDGVSCLTTTVFGDFDWMLKGESKLVDGIFNYLAC